MVSRFFSFNFHFTAIPWVDCRSSQFSSTCPRLFEKICFPSKTLRSFGSQTVLAFLFSGMHPDHDSLAFSAKKCASSNNFVTFMQVSYECRKVKKTFFFKFRSPERRSRLSDTLASSKSWDSRHFYYTDLNVNLQVSRLWTGVHFTHSAVLPSSCLVAVAWWVCCLCRNPHWAYPTLRWHHQKPEITIYVLFH